MALVSVVIPAYNAGQYVEAAIESVLSQTFSDYEVLVVDDGSSDDTSIKVGRYRDGVRYVGQPNAGVSAARNHGIELATGRYVAFLDADDTWMPNKIEAQMTALRAAPMTRVCYTAFLVANVRLRPIRVQASPRRGPLLEDLLLVGNVVGSPTTVMCERSLLDQVGGFDTSLSQCADWDMWIRLSMFTDFAYVNAPLATYRQHAENMSRDIPLYEKDAMRVLDKAFGSLSLHDGLKARRRQSYGRMRTVLAGSYLHAFRVRDFLRCAAAAVALDWRQLGYFVGVPLRRASDVLTRGRSA